MLNKFIATGRLARDIQLFNVDDENRTYGRFGLVIQRSRAKNGQQDADYVNCLCFGQVAKFISKYMKQGSPITIEGKVQSGSYDKQIGSETVKVYTTEVKIDEVHFAGYKVNDSEVLNENSSDANVTGTPSEGWLIVEDSDVPEWLKI